MLLSLNLQHRLPAVPEQPSTASGSLIRKCESNSRSSHRRLPIREMAYRSARVQVFAHSLEVTWTMTLHVCARLHLTTCTRTQILLLNCGRQRPSWHVS